MKSIRPKSAPLLSPLIYINDLKFDTWKDAKTIGFKFVIIWKYNCITEIKQTI